MPRTDAPDEMKAGDDAGLCHFASEEQRQWHLHETTAGALSTHASSQTATSQQTGALVDLATACDLMELEALGQSVV